MSLLARSPKPATTGRALVALPPPPPRTEARQALADAIRKAGEAALEQQALSEGLEKARDHVYKSEEAVAAAQAALVAAKQGAAGDLIASVLGGETSPVSAIRDARAAVRDAEDDLEVARVARSAIVERLEAIRTDGTLQTRALFVEEGIRRVLREEVADDALRLLVYADRLQVALFAITSVISQLVSNHAFPNVNEFPPVDREFVSNVVTRSTKPIREWSALGIAKDTRVLDLFNRMLTDADAQIPDFVPERS